MFRDIKPKPPPDPTTLFEGRCGTCRTVVTVPRLDTAVGGSWKDMRSCECPNCKARVYLTEVKKDGNEIEREDDDSSTPLERERSEVSDLWNMDHGPSPQQGGQTFQEFMQGVPAASPQEEAKPERTPAAEGLIAKLLLALQTGEDPRLTAEELAAEAELDAEKVPETFVAKDLEDY